MSAAEQISEIRSRVAAFNHWASKGTHVKTQELVDLEVVLARNDVLAQALTDIAQAHSGLKGYDDLRMIAIKALCG